MRLAFQRALKLRLAAGELGGGQGPPPALPPLHPRTGTAGRVPRAVHELHWAPCLRLEGDWTLTTKQTTPTSLRRLWEDLPPEEAAKARAAAGPLRPGFNVNADGSRAPLGPEIEVSSSLTLTQNRSAAAARACVGTLGCHWCMHAAAAAAAACFCLGDMPPRPVAPWACTCLLVTLITLGFTIPLQPRQFKIIDFGLAKFSAKTAAAAAGREAQVRLSKGARGCKSHCARQQDAWRSLGSVLSAVAPRHAVAARSVSAPPCFKLQSIALLSLPTAAPSQDIVEQLHERLAQHERIIFGSEDCVSAGCRSLLGAFCVCVPQIFIGLPPSERLPASTAATGRSQLQPAVAFGCVPPIRGQN